MAKQSKAAQSMCLWVRAMDTYARAFRVVEPKRQALAAARAALDDTNSRLAGKRAQLADINSKAGPRCLHAFAVGSRNAAAASC